MKAQDLQLTQLLEGSKQFIIPIFQRTYSWEESHCQQLWDDIIRVGKSSDLDSHFIGSAVYIPETNVDAAIPRWLVIDGQQRLTTITLLLIALKRRLAAEDIDEPVSAEQIDDLYLRNRYGKGKAAYRMLLTRTDKETLVQLADDKEPDEKGSYRIIANFQFFSKQIDKADLSDVWKGIKKLMIVDVCLQQGIDNPQMIFESMNSTGKALTQADLIRNFVLMGLEHDLQTRLYHDYWRPMEVEFGAENYIGYFDDFMRYYLVIKTKNHRIKKDEVYTEFKTYSRKFKVEELLQSLKEFATYYCRIALGTEKDKMLGRALQDIRELRAEVTYPLLMELYHDYESEDLSYDEFVEAVRIIESYVFRRAICEIPTNSMRQTFATFAKSLRKDRYLESLKAGFLLLKSYRRFPSDEEFHRLIQSRNLYKWNRRSYWLRRLENDNKKEYVPVSEYTIEHIMPQNENLSDVWKNELGDDWQRVHEQYLHTLGNLTLTGYNSEYCDRPFKEKRDMENGFGQSPLRLNQGLGQSEIWNESAIQQRAKRLASVAMGIWTAPALPQDILQAYQPKADDVTEYSIGDHPKLASGKSRDLFEAFRIAVLDLDECVTEEFKKLYVAYKAETNFVDAVPQATRLRLSLNLDYPEIEDPKDLCKDVTGLGRWGNGNVQVIFEQLDDLPYIIGLIRQSLEKQLGDE